MRLLVEENPQRVLTIDATVTVENHSVRPSKNKREECINDG